MPGTRSHDEDVPCEIIVTPFPTPLCSRECWNVRPDPGPVRATVATRGEVIQGSGEFNSQGPDHSESVALIVGMLDLTPCPKHIRLLLSLFEVAPVNRAVIENALDLGFSDFEDAVLVEAARHAGADYVITRNITDFKNASIPAYTPTGFLQVMKTFEAE